LAAVSCLSEHLFNAEMDTNLQPIHEKARTRPMPDEGVLARLVIKNAAEPEVH
jgi:hypothetical protein